MTDDTDDQDTTERGTGTRLEFRTAPSTSVPLDGVWWPRTRDSAHELTALVKALDAKQAQVRLVMLNPHGWHGRPRRITVADHSVQVEWITMLDRSVVICSTARGRRLDVQLVVPTDADGPGAGGAAAGPGPTTA
jgi:hypothetical protein